MTKTLPCGCILGLYSSISKWCDRHYQQLLDERYEDDLTLSSLSSRIIKENEARKHALEAAIAHLRNIDTRPGPNAGQKIDRRGR